MLRRVTGPEAGLFGGGPEALTARARGAGRAALQRCTAAARRRTRRAAAETLPLVDARHPALAARRPARGVALAAAGNGGRIGARLGLVTATLSAERLDARVAPALGLGGIGTDQPRRAASLAARREAGLADTRTAAAGLAWRTARLAAWRRAGFALDLRIAPEWSKHRRGRGRRRGGPDHLEDAPPGHIVCRRPGQPLEPVAHGFSPSRRRPRATTAGSARQGCDRNARSANPSTL
jgi:hypothetical protein